MKIMDEKQLASLMDALTEAAETWYRENDIAKFPFLMVKVLQESGFSDYLLAQMGSSEEYIVPGSREFRRGQKEDKGRTLSDSP